MTNSAKGRGTDCGSFIVDRRGTVLGFDEGLEQLTGWKAVNVVGHHKSALGGSDGGANEATVALYKGEIPMVEDARRLAMELSCNDGRGLGVEAVAIRLNGPGDRVMVTVMRVMSRSADTDPIATGSNKDALTGLSNRDVFRKQLSLDAHAAMTAARPLALILLDVDHLRDLNDSRGREAGDDVLKQVAGILRVSVDNEHRIFRIGGDEFGVLLANAGRGEARQIAAAIRSAVERHRFFRKKAADDRPVTVSLGAASLPTDAERPGDLLERAQEALDEARKMGRNRVWCYLRRPRIPLSVPVFFDGAESLLVGYTRDLSPSGIFVQTSAPIDIGMRCALAFPLPGHSGKVHVIGRIVRTVPPEMSSESTENRIPGMGVEFERFGRSSDRLAIDTFLHGLESTSLRPERGMLSV